MDNRRISVTVSDGRVVINGIAHTCLEGVQLDPKAYAIHWTPGEHPNNPALLPGYISRGGGDSHHFGEDQFAALLQPAVDAWEKAHAEHQTALEAGRKVATERKAKLDAEAAEQEARFKAEAEAREARAKDMQAYYEAMSYLGTTDHEIVKAAEAFLVAHAPAGMPADLIEKRRKAREVAKAEKIRLKLQDPYT